MESRWRSRVYVGASRPVARVTVQIPKMRLFSYNLSTTYSIKGVSSTPTGIPSSLTSPVYDLKHGRRIQQVYADFLFSPSTADPKELPNVRSVTWGRNADQDIATCTITMVNTEVLEDEQFPVAGEIDQPGYYTPTRGQSVYSSKWSQVANEWAGYLFPDNIVRTYEGYGCNPDVSPELDTNLAITGTWMIDKVSMNARGELTLNCRDLGRLLLDHQIFDPVVPKDFYPLSFENWDGKVNLGNRNPATGKLRMSVDDTSNTPWIGNGTVGGHKPSYVLDGKPACVDPATQILTLRGWLNYDLVVPGDQTMTIDPDTWETRWEPILHVGEYDFVGEMFQIDQRMHSSLSTGNHRWPTRRRQRGKSTLGGYLYGITSSEDLGCEDQIPLAGSRVDLPKEGVYLDELVELIGWWWTDGAKKYSDGRTTSVVICQSEKANPEKVDRIESVLRRYLGPPGYLSHQPHHTRSLINKVLSSRSSGVNYKQIHNIYGIDHRTVKKWESGDTPSSWNRKSRASGMVHFTISSEIADTMNRLCPDKIPSYEFIMALTEKQLNIFLHSSILADGSYCKNSGQVSFSSAKETGIRLFEFAAIQAGFSISTSKFFQETKFGACDIWRCYLLDSSTVQPKSNGKSLKRAPYDGVVWCPQTPSGTWMARRDGHAFFTGNSFWLSIGNDRPSRRFAYEWVQLKTHGKAKINEVRFRSVRKGYIAYVSVFANGSWQGAHTIDYFEDGIGMNGADIPYVKSHRVSSEAEQVVHFPEIKGATKVRVTFGNLQNFPNNGPYHYRAGIREISVFGSADKRIPTSGQLTPGPEGSNPGRYQDYTNIVKLLCAWGGFLWPKNAYFRATDGTHIPATFTKNDDKVLGHGVNARVWGDFQDSGTSGPSPLNAENFDKKSLMDGIKYIKDILGFHFAIDETGAIVWRMPNVHDRGNWITLSTTPGRTSRMYTIHEDTLLTDFVATLDSENVREKILVSDLTGKLASTARGYNPNPVGLRRVSAWTDQSFASKKETRVMAELIAVRALFSYRTGSVTIPGFPGLQVDDQIRLVERVTSEGYVHYLKSISSSLDMVSGTYTYNLETHWLGIDPKSKWLIDPSTFSEDTRNYISNLLETIPKFRKGSY